MAEVRVCVISSLAKRHPASQNVIKILKALLREENVEVLSSGFLAGMVPKPLKLMAYLIDEALLSLKLLKILHRVSAIFILQEYHVIASLMTRLSGRKLVLLVGGSPFQASFHREKESRSLLSSLIYGSNLLITMICNELAHRIVVVTPSLVDSAELARHRGKVSLASVFPYISQGPNFDITKRHRERELMIGFVGRLERIKGVLNFVEAMPLILKSFPDLRILIIGDGPLRATIEEKIEAMGISGTVKILGKVPHERMPHHYNSLKLLVLPSYSEGLPLAMLEAMSCGTPALATAVGGIPDVIRDGETGFILRSNDPEHIAERVVELLSRPDLLEEVSERAYNWVRENLSAERALKSWRDILEKLS